MAGATFANTSGSKEYPGKLTVFVFLTCLVAATGGLIFGYDIGISGGVTSMDTFLSRFFPSVYRKEKEDRSTNQYCEFDSQLLTTFTSSLYLAALVASFFASAVIRMLGRKWSMLSGGDHLPRGRGHQRGCAKRAHAHPRPHPSRNRHRIRESVCTGLPIRDGTTRLRGMLNIGFQLMINVSILAANLINYASSKIEGGWGWRVSLALAAVPAAIITIGSLFLPDTPNSLIQRGHDKEAMLMLRRIRGTDDVAEYSLVNLVCIFVSVFTVDKLGRRMLFIQGGLQMLVCQIVVGTLIAIKFGTSGEGHLTKSYAGFVVLFICLCVAGFAWSWGPLGWLVPSKISPLEIRSAGQSITVSVNMLFTFVVAQTFLAMLCRMKFGLFYFFGGGVLIMTVFVALFLPETKK